MILSLEEQSKAVAPDNAIGRITRMDVIQQRSLAEAQLRSHEETLYKLEKAFIKIDQEHFCVCVECKKNIPLERILIMPEAKICVPCASKP